MPRRDLASFVDEGRGEERRPEFSGESEADNSVENGQEVQTGGAESKQQRDSRSSLQTTGAIDTRLENERGKEERYSHPNLTL